MLFKHCTYIIMLNDIIDHIRNRSYMSGVARDRARVKATGEVFTPTPLVQKLLNELPDELYSDPTKTFLDNSCGDGQFLGEVLIKKIEHGSSFEQALSTVYGVDIMQDNVDLCRERLLCGREDLRHIVEQNIQCKDGLKYGYQFEPMGPARRKTEARARKKYQLLEIKRQKEQELQNQKKAKEKHEKKLFGEILEKSN